MTTVWFSKESLSEKVLRKALYWLSESGGWELSEDSDQFKVVLAEDSLTEELNRLVNDFKLREELDIRTSNARENVVMAALKRLTRAD